MLYSLRWLFYLANQEGFYKNPIQLKFINMGYGALKSIQIMPKAVMTFVVCMSSWKLKIYFGICIALSAVSQPLENSVLHETQNFGTINYKWHKSA